MDTLLIQFLQARNHDLGGWCLLRDPDGIHLEPLGTLEAYQRIGFRDPPSRYPSNHPPYLLRRCNAPGSPCGLGLRVPISW
jgi:hypothetical protein